MASGDTDSDAQVLQRIIEALRALEAEDRRRILQTVSTFFGDDLPVFSHGTSQRVSSVQGSETITHAPLLFSDREDVSPKDFMMEKKPRTDVERVACLGFYLANYRDMPHFKTLEISKLNTEAAQIKFSNASVAVNNALQMGYLTHAGKGQKQLSAVGEQFVSLLPDRDAAKSALARLKQRRTRRRPRKRSGK